MIIIIAGVSGSGKTTIGKRLSIELQLPFYDADDFHPAENIAKMSQNQPLTDSDRLPWLMNLAVKIKEWEKIGGAILACSALKASYRQILEKEAQQVHWVFLNGSFELIQQRLENRSNHFMPTGLLQTQFDDLELPTNAFIVNVEQPINLIIYYILRHFMYEKS